MLTQEAPRSHWIDSSGDSWCLERFVVERAIEQQISYGGDAALDILFIHQADLNVPIVWGINEYGTHIGIDSPETRETFNPYVKEMWVLVPETRTKYRTMTRTAPERIK